MGGDLGRTCKWLAANLVGELRKVPTGVLQLGMLTTAKYFVPHLLAAFMKEHPGVQPRLTGNRQELVDALHRNEQVDIAELTRATFIIREPGSGSRLTMEALFREWRISPPVLMQMTSNESIKQAVMANLGIPFLSLHTVADELRAGKLVLLRVGELPLMREWQLVHLSARVLSPAAEMFRHYVLENGQAFLRRRLEAAPEDESTV